MSKEGNEIIEDLTSKVSAERICRVIDFLKAHKISQQEIEERINYTSLSKAKNHARYPQKVIEKRTRQEVLIQLLNEFDLVYNEQLDTVHESDNKDELHHHKMVDTSYYVMHYYAFARNTVDRGIIAITNKRKVIIDYRLDEHWEGIYNVVENYTFIEVQKTGDTTPVKKLICLFSGTKKHGRPILLGTYSTVKRDGYPAAGRILLQKVESKEEALTVLEQDSDPRISCYLSSDVYISDTYTPNNLDELNPFFYLQLHQLVGDYKLIYPTMGKQWMVCKMQIKDSRDAFLNLNNVQYTGKVLFPDINTLQIIFNRKEGYTSFDLKYLIILNVNIRRKSNSGLFTAIGTSNILHGSPSSFNSYLMRADDELDLSAMNLPINLFIGEPLD